jgi:hypothetical protein
LKTKKLEKIHTRLQAIISKGQCTHNITLESNISTINGVNIIHVFLNHDKNKLMRKATDTVAWSEGKDASGI